MKAKELMIDDWVRFEHSDLCHKVYAVQGKSAKVDKQYWYKADKLHPVPLTAEILDKNYEEVCRSKDGTSYEWGWCVETGYVEISKSEDAYGVSRYYLTANDGEYRVMLIRYVHELQHALRLCGIDKEIEL